MRNFILKVINSVEDETSLYDEYEIKEGKDMGILCYIFPLIPYFLNKKNLFVKYHSIIGMNLFILVLFYYLFFKIIVSMKISFAIVQVLLTVIWLIFLLLACVGISNVCNGKARALPLINKIKIFK